MLLTASVPHGPHREVMDSALKRRRKTSAHERICHICSQSFSKAEHLLRHVRSHAKEKPFQCAVCGRMYARQDTLLRHSRSHSGSQRRASEVVQDNIDVAVYGDNNSSHQSASYNALNGVSYVAANSSPSILNQTPDRSIILNNGPLSSASDTRTFQYDTEITHSDSISDVNNVSVSVNVAQSDDFWGKDDLSAFSIESFLDGMELDPEDLTLSFLQATGEYPINQAPPDPIAPSQGLGVPVIIDENQPVEAIGKLQQNWHTYFVSPKSGIATPIPRQDQERLDEEYHRKLAARLQPRVQEALLPSTSFLELCVQAYFANFHSIFPIIHAPTFRPHAQNGILLLSICSIGSLFMGSPRALSHGISMYEKLNKATLGSWDTTITHRGSASHVGFQASILGQTFGLLVGRPKDLMQIQLFHGSMMVWARGLGLFRPKKSPVNFEGLDHQSLEDTWRSWIIDEERRRATLALLVLDAEIGRMFHSSPARISLSHIPRSSTREAFSASKARSWRDILIKDRAMSATASTHTSPSSLSSAVENIEARLPAHPSSFDMFVLLERIGSMATECSDPLFPVSYSTTECENMLLSWLDRYRTEPAFQAQESSLMMLWHSIFMSLTMNLDALECASGRDGIEVMNEHQQLAKSWAVSAQARRCIAHSILLQRQFELIPLGIEPPLHAAACLYRCGIAWYCFSRFGSDKRLAPHELTAMTEMRLLPIDANSILMEDRGSRFVRPKESTLIRIIDLLQRISHWRVAERFASTLLNLLEHDSGAF